MINCTNPVSVNLSNIAKSAFKTFAKGGMVVFDRGEADISNLPSVIGRGFYEETKLAPKIDLDKGLRLIKEARNSG